MDKNSTSHLLNAAKKSAVLVCTVIALCIMSISSYGQTVVTYTTSGSFTVPPGVTSVTVYCWGGGGGGGGATLGGTGSAGGGGGGGAISTAVVAVTAGQSCTIVVGAGGTAGAAGNHAGVTGGTSSFAIGATTYCSAIGGTGGNGSPASTNGTLGGAGGTSGTGYLYMGGTGAAGGVNSNGGFGGGGGGGAGSSSAGSNGAAGTFVAGGGSNGGPGGTGTYPGGAGAKGTYTTTDRVGVAGTAPGGGGSGGESITTSKGGGAGGAGQVVIIYTAVTTPTITSFSPNPVCTGATLTVTGTNFVSGGTITFTGAAAVAYTYVSATSVTVTVPATATTGTFSITTSGGTATSPSSLTVNTSPAAPTFSNTGTNNVCPGTAESYAVTSVGGITYAWSVAGAGWSGTSATSTFNTNAGTGNGSIYVTANNGTCTSSIDSTITTVIQPPAQPSAISPATAVCANSAQTYSVTNIAGVTYTWAFPAGWTITSAQGNNSINVTVGTAGGTITVTPSNSCGTAGTAQTLTATVNATTVTPSAPIPATGYIAAGASTVTVYGFTLTPNSCVSSYSFLSAQITTAGTATTTDLSNFSLYYDVNANGVYDAGTDILASGPISLAATLTFPITNQTGITAARNYIVVANVATGAVPGHTFTANISNASGLTFTGATQSGTIGGYTQTIEGSVTIAAIQPAAAFLTDGTTSNEIAGYSVTVNTGSSYTPSSFTFTTAGTYTATTDLTNFKLWQSTSNSFSTGTATLLETITAAGNPQTLVFNTFSTAPTAIALSGTSYFYITTDVATTGINGDNVNIATDALSNFVFNAAAVVSGTNPTTVGNPQTIKAPLVTITTQGIPATGTLSQGTTSNPIAAYLINVGGYSVTPTSFVFTTAGSYSNATDIDSLELYENSSNSVLGATLIQKIAAPVSGGTATFNTGFTSLAIGNVYFIVAADVDACAVNGDAISIASGSANFANFSFTSSFGAVSKTGPVNPAAAGNAQTVAAPAVTLAAYTYSAGTVNQSSTSNILAIYSITAGSVAVTPSSFVFTTAGSYTATTDFTNFQLYVNDNPNTGSPFQTLTDATATPGPGGTITFNSFTGSSTIPANTTRYFVVTADVPSTGINGDYVSIAAEPVSNFTFVGCVSKSPSTGNLAAGTNQTIYGPTVAITTESMPAAANITVGTNSNIIAVYTLNTSNATSVTPSSLTLTTVAAGYAASDFSAFHIYENTNATLSGSPTLAQTVSSVGPGSSLVFSTATGATFTGISSGVTTYLIVTADVAAGATLGDYIDFTTTSFTNFTFTSSAGSVAETGTNPAAASNQQTIVGPSVAITEVSPVAGSMLVGSTNNLLAAYKLVVTNGASTPTSVTLVTSGNIPTPTYAGAADIANFYLYQNTSNSLSGATLVGTIAAGANPQTLVFNSGNSTFTQITSGTTSYLLLSADVAGGATPNNYIYISNTTATGAFSFNTTATVTGGTLAQSYNQTIVTLLDVYWTGTNYWNTVNTNTDWWQTPTFTGPNLWVVDGRAHLGGTAGTITLNSGAVTAAQIFDSTVNTYFLTSSGTGNTATLSTPSNIYVGTGTMYAGTTATVASANPVFGGINGLQKTGAGELAIGSTATPFTSTFAGGLYVNGGTLTLGTKGLANSNPKAFLPGNNIVINGSNLTIAANEGVGIINATGFPPGNGCLQNVSSVVSTGNSSITLYKTRATTTNIFGYVTNYPYMGVVPAIDAPSSTNYPYGGTVTDMTPLKVSGTLSVNGAGNVTGILGEDNVYTVYYSNYMAFGGTSLTGNTTFQAYSAANTAAAINSGTEVNLSLGGVGNYLNNVSTVSSQPINDSGFAMTFLGNGSSTSDGANISLNAASSTMTGNWTVGDAAGTNAAWLLTNTGTCLTLGKITVNNYSKVALHIVTTANVNVTYAPDTISLYGVGPASSFNVTGYGAYKTQQFYPGALDLFNYGTAAGYGATTATVITVQFPSKVILNQSTSTHLCGISAQVAGDINTTNGFPGTANFQFNAPFSGNGGIQKSWPGVLILNAQNISGLYNTYSDTTEIKGGGITVNYGSNLGTGPVVMYQDSCYFAFTDLEGFNTSLTLNNTKQTISSLSSYWTNTGGGNYSQTVNINGCTLTDSQYVNTTFGNGTVSTFTGLIAGTGTFIKTQSGTLTLTGANTYTGLTQVKGGTLALSHSGGTTLPTTNSVDILGGTLSVTTAQTFKNVTLSSGTLNIASGVTLTITGNFTLVNGTITGGGTLAYSNGTLIYAGSSAQTVNSVNSPIEWPGTNAPTNVTFDNNTYTGYTTGGVKLIAGKTIPSGGTATVNGWLDFSGNSISGAGAFTLNGLTSKSYTGNVTSGSIYITNMSSNNGIYPGMLVTGTGIPSNTYIIYIDTVLQSKSGTSTLYLNNSATATGTAVALTITTRGGVKVSLPRGLDNSGTGHVQVTGTKTYNSGASYVFNTPTTGTQIYPGFPTTPSTATYTPAWDVKINVGSGNNITMSASGVGSSIEVADSLVLATGVWATNTGLITWDNPGTSYMNVPQPTWAANSTAYINSFIATCDSSGNPVSVAGATSAFGGNSGFKIKSVTNVDTYFPVGASFISAYPAYSSLPSPNRMMIHNSFGTPEDFTVVVNYGDVGFTYGSTAGAYRVNRIWYVKTSASQDAGEATMKLFYTKRNNSVGNWLWPSAGGENEVEAGFIYTQNALVEKDYSGIGTNFIRLSDDGDVMDFSNAVTYPLNTEVYGVYTIGISHAIDSSTNGIQLFNRFSIVNPQGIVLPVKVIDFRAYQQGSGVQTSWTCLNEANMDHYEVERSANATDFITLGSVTALNKAQPSVTYGFYDKEPLQGDNYYRIKVVGKDGSISYTNTEVVVIGGGLSGINIFPNPVTQNTFTLQLTNIPAGQYTLIVYNTLGQKILNQEIGHSGGSASQTIYLPAGTARGEYHLRLLGTGLEVDKTMTVE